ncbi:MAG: hypothetical protein K0S61_4029 [Anaerocolumna sp.]|nr:hypothetical protein [Anaerocolumna sp.]
MLADKTISICIKDKDSGHLDDMGVWVEDFVTLKTIQADIQPYSQKLLLQKYGIDIEVNKRIFIDYEDSEIKVGRFIQYINKQSLVETYEIKAIPWDDGYMDVMVLGKVSASS